MNLLSKPRVKICCISSVQEAMMAINAGASAIGLVSNMPSGPGVITEDLISEIAGSVPPGVASFLLTSLTSVDEIIAQRKRCKTNTIQLCDYLTPQNHIELRKALPGISIVQVVHVVDEESVEYALKASENVNALLLDSGNTKLAVKELGGTGRIHNWEISRQIRDSVSIPIFLAGGLNPQNVRAAIEKVEPFGIDVCSGVRTNGKLDKQKLDEFFSQIEMER